MMSANRKSHRPTCALMTIVFSLLIGSSFHWGYLLTELDIIRLVMIDFAAQKLDIINDDVDSDGNEVDLTENPKSVRALSLWCFVVASRFLGDLTAALFLLFFMQSLSRKWLIVSAAALAIVGCVLEALTFPLDSLTILIFGRIIHGLFLGTSQILTPVFLEEISPNTFRPLFIKLHYAFQIVGAIFGLFLGFPNLLGTRERFPFLVALPGLLTFVCLLCIFPVVARESPKYLIFNKHEIENAWKSFELYQGRTDDINLFLRRSKHVKQYDRWEYFHIWELRKPRKLSCLLSLSKALLGFILFGQFCFGVLQMLNLPSLSGEIGAVAIFTLFLVARSISPGSGSGILEQWLSPKTIYLTGAALIGCIYLTFIILFIVQSAFNFTLITIGYGAVTCFLIWALLYPIISEPSFVALKSTLIHESFNDVSHCLDLVMFSFANFCLCIFFLPLTALLPGLGFAILLICLLLMSFYLAKALPVYENTNSRSNTASGSHDSSGRGTDVASPTAASSRPHQTAAISLNQKRALRAATTADKQQLIQPDSDTESVGFPVIAPPVVKYGALETI